MASPLRHTLQMAVLVMTCSASVAAASPISAGPYLTELGATHVVVRAETESSESLTAVVEVARADRADAAAGSLRVADPAPHAGVHAMVFDGLAARTTYRYQIAGEGGEFTTAPADDDPSPIRFILYGDDRGGIGIHRNIARHMLDEASDFFVNSGDLVADGRNGAQWEAFFDVEDNLLRDHCLFAAIGNHELVEESGSSYLRFFGTAEQQKTHQLYTTFRWGMARFFFLNGEGTFLGEDRDWLERELRKADDEPGLVWRIVVVHNGPFSSGMHGDNDKMHGGDVPSLLRQHHVDFVLEGHDHIYERGASDGLRYVVSGGAGAPLYALRPPRPGSRKLESTHHYVLFTLDRDKGRLMTKRIDGSVLEDIGFTKTNLWDDDPPSAAERAKAPQVAPEQAAAPAPEAESKPHESHTAIWLVAGLVAVAAAGYFARRRRTTS
ncbi:MAG TPA: metallophosphoesterase [Polyangiaceae bacterium]|nr:metallophosphoesterase [Polyangiaceae bacterium]